MQVTYIMHILTYEASEELNQRIFIKTKDSFIKFNNSDNLNNITLHLNPAIQRANEDYTFLVSLNNLQIYVSWFTISAYNNNNTFVYSLNDIEYSYTIPDGNHTALELLEVLNSNLLLTVTFDFTTYEYTFSHDTYDFEILSSTSCYDELGFYNITYSSVDRVITSIKPIDLGGSRELYIKTNLTTKNIESTNGMSSSKILDCVPIDVDNFNMIRYTNYEGYKVKVLNSEIDIINVIITDDKNREINIKNHYSLTIEINQIQNKKFHSSNIDHTKII